MKCLIWELTVIRCLKVKWVELHKHTVKGMTMDSNCILWLKLVSSAKCQQVIVPFLNVVFIFRAWRSCRESEMCSLFPTENTFLNNWLLNWTQIHFYISVRVLVLMLYACYLYEFELQNMYWCSFSFPRWRNLNATKITPSQEGTESELESTLSCFKDLFTMLLHWGPGCWHGYSNSCCSWQGRGAGRHKAWDESPCRSCISGGTAEGRLPEVAPQAADQVQVDSLHIVILRQ